MPKTATRKRYKVTFQLYHSRYPAGWEPHHLVVNAWTAANAKQEAKYLIDYRHHKNMKSTPYSGPEPATTKPREYPR